MNKKKKKMQLYAYYKELIPIFKESTLCHISSAIKLSRYVCNYPMFVAKCGCGKSDVDLSSKTTILIVDRYRLR